MAAGSLKRGYTVGCEMQRCTSLFTVLHFALATLMVVEDALRGGHFVHYALLMPKPYCKLLQSADPSLLPTCHPRTLDLYASFCSNDCDLLLEYDSCES